VSKSDDFHQIILESLGENSAEKIPIQKLKGSFAKSNKDNKNSNITHLYIHISQTLKEVNITFTG